MMNDRLAGFAPPTTSVLRSRLAHSAVSMAGVGDACTGTCKWFDVAKGFGFITIDGEETDIFVHQTEIYSPGFRSLAENEKLEFKISADDRTGALAAAPAPARVFRCHLCPRSPPLAPVRRQAEGCRGHRARWRLRAGRAARVRQPVRRRQRWLLNPRNTRILCLAALTTLM